MACAKNQTYLIGTLTFSLLALALMAGCSDPVPGSGELATPTRGGDGSEITLNALTAEDISGASLSGELACQFMAEEAGPLLFARGNVASSDAAQGVVKVAGYVERVSAPGGFDGMTASPTFRGKGKTVHIDVTGEPTEGGESPSRPATLTYDRADGAQRVSGAVGPKALRRRYARI